MEVESVPYIFGSFTRRKPSHAYSNSAPTGDNFDKKKLQPDIRGKHTHSKSQPETGNVTQASLNSKQMEDRALRTRSCNVTLNPLEDKSLLSATCPMCHHVFLEPRVLDCLHSFCTRCLQEIMDKNRESGEVWTPKNDHLKEDSSSSTYSSKSPLVDSADKNVHSTSNMNQICCPVCEEKTSLNRQGVLGLPPDYVVQHRLVLATLNDENTKLLCDLCTGDIVAVERCTQCMVNVCTVCSAIHKRHARTAKHKLLKLREVRRKGLMRIHRHLMCQAHPEHELIAYCTQCEQTICRLCISLHHSSHQRSTFAPIAASHSQRLRRLLSKARGVTSRDQTLRRRLMVARRVVQRRCQKVTEEVEKYMEEYRRVVEEHRQKLLGEIENIRSSLLSHLSTFESSISSRLQNSSTAINFTQTLLEEGSDVELLSFVSRLLKKLEDLEKPVKIAEDLKEILKQTTIGRNSEEDGLVDFIRQDIIEDGELQKCNRNFDAFRRPIKHVLVDFVPVIDDLNFNNTRRPVSSDEIKFSENLNPIYEDTNKNIAKELNNTSLGRKSNQFYEEISSKPHSGILNQLRNCLDNLENKNSKLESHKNTKFDHKIQMNNAKNSSESIFNSLDNLSNSDSPEDPIVLEFLPQEAEIYPEKTIPVVFGQIKKLTSSSPEGSNCCSASRPHLGRSPLQRSKNCCGIKLESKMAANDKIDCKTIGNNRKSDSNGKVYEITI